MRVLLSAPTACVRACDLACATVYLRDCVVQQPYLIPFIVEEFSLSEAQRAQLLAAFTPG